jgi:hypothetical protein
MWIFCSSFQNGATPKSTGQRASTLSYGKLAVLPLIDGLILNL